jgi:beta-phosphoglucomutase-like phosphatase (HAD superfamily)
MSHPVAIVFDFDGVLADTERLHLLAFQDAFGSRGWALDEKAYFADYLGYDDYRFVAEFARAQGAVIDRPAIDALVAVKGRRYRDRLGSAGVVFPQAAPCVRRLAARFPLGIASGSLRAEIDVILEAAGLSGAFPVIVAADDVAACKPDPEPYLTAVRRLGVRPGAAVAVEDSRWGLESARAAGLRTIALTTSYPVDALRPADAIVNSLDELTIELVESLLGAAT